MIGIPAGLCQCGCARATRLAPCTDRVKGWIAGQPLAYVLGHNRNVGRSVVAERLATCVRKPCLCGCGQIAPLSRQTGKPCDYVASHNSRIHRTGYVRKRVDGQSRQEHQVVAERAIGKPLPPRAEVHHVDGNPRNNANRNLVICQDCDFHMLLHARMRVVRAGGNPNTHRLCCDCGLQPNEAFNRRKHKSDLRYQSACRACQSRRSKAYAEAKKAAREARKAHKAA